MVIKNALYEFLWYLTRAGEEPILQGSKLRSFHIIISGKEEHMLPPIISDWISITFSCKTVNKSQIKDSAAVSTCNQTRRQKSSFDKSFWFMMKTECFYVKTHLTAFTLSRSLFFCITLFFTLKEAFCIMHTFNQFSPPTQQNNIFNDDEGKNMMWCRHSDVI